MESNNHHKNNAVPVFKPKLKIQMNDINKLIGINRLIKVFHYTHISVYE